MTAEERTPVGAPNETGALPLGTTVLHIGAPKTGTTSLQQSVDRSRRRLRAGSVLYPGQQENHRQFARSLLGLRREPWHAEPAPAHWATRVLGQLENNERDYALVSSEAFSIADASGVARVRAAFTMPTHVVLTLRPLPGMLLSMWQQRVKNGAPELLDTWLDAAFRELPVLHMPGADVFDESDGTDLVGRWADAFGPENMTVVVLDPTDRDHIFRVFEDLLSQPRGTLDRVSANSGMSAVETEFFRLAAEQVARESGSSMRRRLFHGGAVNAVISERPRRPDEPSLRVPEWAVARAASAAIRIAQQIESSGVRVVGDITDLAAAGRFGDPAPFPEAVPSDLALVAARGLARRAIDLRGAAPGAPAAPGALETQGTEGADVLPAAAELLVTGAPGSCVEAVRRALVRGSADLRGRGVRYVDGLADPPGNGLRVVVSEAAWSYTDEEARALRGAQEGVLRAVVVVEPPALLAVRSWQDDVTRGTVRDLGAYLTERLPDADAAADPGARAERHPALGRDPVGPWVDALGAENVTVVVPPARDHMLLASVVDVLVGSADGLVARLAAGESAGDRRLSAVEAEFLVALDAHLASDELADDADLRRMCSSAVRRVLDARSAGADEGVLGVPRWALGRLQEAGQALAERIAAYGVRTEGDLADLAAAPLAGTVPDGRSERIPSDLGLHAVLGVYDGARRVLA